MIALVLASGRIIALPLMFGPRAEADAAGSLRTKGGTAAFAVPPDALFVTGLMALLVEAVFDICGIEPRTPTAVVCDAGTPVIDTPCGVLAI